jgi:hypothetical protein
MRCGRARAPRVIWGTVIFFFLQSLSCSNNRSYDNGLPQDGKPRRPSAIRRFDKHIVPRSSRTARPVFS